MNNDQIIDLRQAFGQFATGVTIVTALGPGDEPIGVTANSFSSVSLDPPMILWSLAVSAMSRRVFERAEHFCVHVLTAAQRELSERFACRGEDKFSGVAWAPGPQAVPMLEEYVARFHCITKHRLTVGDHIVIIGEVLKYDKTDSRPLVFHGGQYAMTDRRMLEEVAGASSVQGNFPRDRRKK